MAAVKNNNPFRGLKVMEIEIKDDKRLVIMWIPKSEENDNRIKALVDTVIKKL